MAAPELSCGEGEVSVEVGSDGGRRGQRNEPEVGDDRERAEARSRFRGRVRRTRGRAGNGAKGGGSLEW